MRKTLLKLVLIGVILFLPILALGNESLPDSNEKFNIRLDYATIAKGYTVAAFNDAIKLSLVPDILDDATWVDVMKLNEPLEFPWQMERLSPVYQFEFRNKAAYDNHKPFYIQLSYDRQDNNYKQVYFYDKNFQAWRPLPTRDYPEDKFVRSLIHLPFARIAVFSYPGVLTVGRASWYGYKGGLYAASPDFPKGSTVRVTNTANGKHVDVEINDWGPDRSIHPDRAIDLDKVAFARIAPLWEGVADVKLEPLEILPDSYGRVLGISGKLAPPRLTLIASSAIVMKEGSGEIIYSKDATTTRPLASLTKLVAIKVFLDTRPTLSNPVVYSDADAEYNYEHCEPWEAAKLNLKDGESVTIEDLLYASLVGSANNTIETLVRASGLARADFIAKMNQTVADWGAKNTYFTEPTGLDPENVSSAADYAIITREVLKHPIIQKTSTMDEYRFTTINTGRGFRVRNTNKIILANRFEINGSKTGYLHESGYCLMTRVKDSDDNLIVVLLGADDRDTSFKETEDLILYGLRSK